LDQHARHASGNSSQLILRLQDAADVAAWDAFVDLYSPALHRVARRQGLRQADAENLVQEVMLSVAKSVAQWLQREDRGSFRSWLLRIARNESVDLLTRRGTRQIGMGGEEVDEILNRLPARGSNDLSSLVDLEYCRQVFLWAADQVRESVSESTWSAFWLTHVEGKSIAEAATELRVRPGNIYFGRSRVMSRIKKLVAQWEEQA